MTASADDHPRLILVVDDSDDVRALWVEVLTEAGYRVVEACDGAAAVELALGHRPRVVLMDMAMPNVDGWEATRRIRAFANEREMAIIAVSAMSEVDGRAAAFRAGCDGFIAKPVTADVILDVVRSFTDPPTEPPA